MKKCEICGQPVKLSGEGLTKYYERVDVNDVASVDEEAIAKYICKSYHMGNQCNIKGIILPCSNCKKIAKAIKEAGVLKWKEKDD